MINYINTNIHDHIQVCKSTPDTQSNYTINMKDRI